jgi:hypothetical protein
MRRYPVSTKLNNSQNESAESATPVTLDTPMQARLFLLQLLLNRHGATLSPNIRADALEGAPSATLCELVREAGGMQDALGLKKMTAFMADNDLESGTDGESNSRDKRIPKANTVDVFGARADHELRPLLWLSVLSFGRTRYQETSVRGMR